MAEDDYIIDDEGGNERPNNRRGFLIAAGFLLGIFILASICSVTLLNMQRRGNGGNQAQIGTATAIAATNQVIMITNEAVTVAIQETNLAQAPASETPEATLPPTSTATEAAATTEPTETAVVEAADDTPTPNLSGTSEFDDDATETPETDDDGETGGAETPDSSGSGSGDSSSDSTPTPVAGNDNTQDSLPETGINTWGTILLGLFFLGILLAARRFRSA